MSAIDDVCRALRDFAQAEGFQRVQVTVRADGHVFFAATNGPGGDRVWTDTLDGATPEAAFARMRGQLGGVRKIDAS